MKPVLIYFIVLLLGTGCTKLSPELGFGHLKTSDEALTAVSSLEYINSSSSNTDIILSGACEANTNLTITVKESFQIKCAELTYSIQIPSSEFSEGQNTVTIEAFDDSKNKMASKEIQILKDTIVPTVTISGPSSIAASATEVLLTGTCSENNLKVLVNETVYSEGGDALCTNGVWSYTHSTQGKATATEFKFTATHLDTVLNETITSPIVVNRIILAGFSILGVSLPGADPSALLRSVTGNMDVKWVASAGASTYDLVIKLRSGTVASTTMCSFMDLTGSSKRINIPSACPSLAVNTEYRIELKAWDVLHTNSITEIFDFKSKAAPALRGDSSILYVNSADGATPPVTNIPFSEIVNDPDSTGPFSISITNNGGLNSQLVAENASVSQYLRVAPLELTSGIFEITIRISDENGIQSANQSLKIVIALPYSWAGLVNNDFNNKSNWCGSAHLRNGCAGQTNNISAGTRVMLDNLCAFPRGGVSASINCSPALSSNTIVGSFFIKDKIFQQNSHSLTVGTVTDNDAYFRMTGGIFNDVLNSGDITFYKEFSVKGGTFTAPASSNVFLNTARAGNNSESFNVLDKNFYVHNNSTLHLLDPNGSYLYQRIAVPDGFTLKNLTINSNGGRWVIKSPNLILDGTLNLIGTKQVDSYPQLEGFAPESKISLRGNINCEGQFGGGGLSVYMINSSSYKTTFANCTLPVIKLDTSGITVSESSASTENTTVQSLIVTSGTFVAPSQSRKLFFRPIGLPTDSIVADLATGFSHNSGEVIFETADTGKNYRLKLGTLYGVGFTNPNNLNATYELSTNISAAYLGFLDSNPIPLIGASKTISVNQSIFETGLVNSANRLSKLQIKSTGFTTALQIDTSVALNIPSVEVLKLVTFSGSSSLFNFSGTVFNLNSFNVTVPTGTQLNYFSKSGTGNFIGGGIAVSGQ